METNNLGVQVKGHNITPDVPYIVHEGMLVRQEHTIRRLWVLCMLIFISLFIALIVTNGMWIYYERQWSTETTVVSQDNDNGNNNYIGESGKIINGQADDNED